MVEIAEHEVEEKHQPLYTSWRRIFTTTHHTHIGLLYLGASIFFLFAGGTMAMLIRSELAAPGPTVTTAAVYNQLFTMHGTIMIFLWLMPAIAAFTNYLLPKFIGAEDMYFPRLNALSFWLLLPGGALIMASMFNVGWTAYTPLSIREGGLGVDLWALGLLFLGTSSTLGAFNFFITFFRLKSPTLVLRRVPLFAWATVATSILLIFALPVLSMALIMLLADRNLGTTFLVDDPILWQHLFWFFGHPEVYILVLPPMGLVSEIIQRLARKPIVGYWSMAISILAISVLSFTVWVHHMFTTGISTSLRWIFMVTTAIIAVPSGVKVFNWVATLYGGRIRMAAPMKFSIAFIASFIVGGITGVWLASVPVDYALQDTYWVVGHFHLVVLASTMVMFAGIYYYFPIWTKRWYSENLATLHFILFVAGVFMTFIAQLVLGLEGMPRRVFDYLPQHVFWNQVATTGGFLMGAGALLFLANIIYGWLRGKPVKNREDPWYLAKYGLAEYEQPVERHSAGVGAKAYGSSGAKA